MYPVEYLSRLACRLGAPVFVVRSSGRSLSGYVACVGFRSLKQARLFACQLSPWLDSRCKGVVVKNKGGYFWASIPVTKESLPGPVLLGRSVCSLGSPPDVRRAFVLSGWA